MVKPQGQVKIFGMKGKALSPGIYINVTYGSPSPMVKKF